MVKEVYIKSIRKISQNKEELEKKLKVKIIAKNGKVTISGDKVDEFFAEKVIYALDFPFELDEALLLLKEDYLFQVINIKDHTHRHDLNVIKGRIIGTKGKTLRVLQELSNSMIAVKDNEIAIIAQSDFFPDALQAILSLIRGSKQGNVYSFLEKAHKRE